MLERQDSFVARCTDRPPLGRPYSARHRRWLRLGALVAVALALPVLDSLGRGRRGGIAIAARLLSESAEAGYPVTAYELIVRGKRGAAPSARATLFLIQDAPCISVLDRVERLARFPEIGIPVVLAEHRGVGVERVMDAATCRATSRAQRVRDHAQVIDAYLRHTVAERSDQPVIVLGEGQGAEVAAAIAGTDSRVTHLILLAAGDSWTTLPARDSEADPPAGQLLRGRRLPIFLGHGARDTQVPIARARAARDAFAADARSRLTYREYARAKPRL